MHAILPLVVALALPGAAPATGTTRTVSAATNACLALTGLTDRPPPVRAGAAYYAIELFTTRNLPATGYARGLTDVTVSARSPFSVALTPDGSYRYELAISLQRMKAPRSGVLVAWVTTPQIDRVERIGALDEAMTVAGSVAWNQFLVVVTLEPTDDPSATTWSGPIAFRGMSRSGMMHTMVGHGALQKENCAAYGYGN